MIEIEAYHLGGAPRGTAGLDGACRAIKHLEEGHETRRGAAATQRFTHRAHGAEVGARAGAVLENASLTLQQRKNSAIAQQIVLDRLNETGMRLRTRISIGGM